MSYGPDIPKVEREVFASPPLKAMLGQVRFPPVLKINDPSAIAGFQDAIRGEFPEYSPEQELNLVLSPSGPRNAALSNAYRFSTADASWAIVLTTETMTLEVALAERYTDYDEFLTRFGFAWEALLEHFQPSRITRQGLRYVDHLEGDRSPGEWAEFINADLLSSFVGPLGSGVEQTMTQILYRRDDGVLAFRHGLVPAGPNGEKGYLLDFDYYNEEPSEDTGLSFVTSRFDQYHELQYAFFRWCVTDRALEEFRRES